MMNKEKKASEVAGLVERFGRAKAAFLVDFKGLDVEEMTSFRKSLRAVKAEVKVVRNTLALRALAERPDDRGALGDKFTGNNAVVFAYEDASGAAKAITEFAKTVEELMVKHGVMDGRSLDEARIKQLAALPSREELRAKLLGTLQAPMGKFLGVLHAVPGGFLGVLGAYKDQKEKNQ